MVSLHFVAFFFSFLVLLHLLSRFCTIFLNGFVLCFTPLLLRCCLVFLGLCIPTHPAFSAPFHMFPVRGFPVQIHQARPPHLSSLLRISAGRSLIHSHQPRSKRQILGATLRLLLRSRQLPGRMFTSPKSSSLHIPRWRGRLEEEREGSKVQH